MPSLENRQYDDRQRLPDEEGKYKMTTESAQKNGLKQKAVHELEEMAVIFLYLAFFFCAIATYSMLLLNKFQVSYFTYGTALINALVIAKVILIGDYMHLGKKREAKSLIYLAVYKAFVFGLLVFAFHIIEEVIKHLVHGESITPLFRETRIDDLLCRTLIIFCTFIPLFAFIELRRVLGESQFSALFFKSRETPKPGL
jgi:hypothetical protein